MTRRWAISDRISRPRCKCLKKVGTRDRDADSSQPRIPSEVAFNSKVKKGKGELVALSVVVQPNQAVGSEGHSITECRRTLNTVQNTLPPE